MLKHPLNVNEVSQMTNKYVKKRIKRSFDFVLRNEIEENYAFVF